MAQTAQRSSLGYGVISMLAVGLLVSACGGGGGSSSPPSSTNYIISGTVSGLDADGLVITNGTNTLAISSGATSFKFSQGLASGAKYSLSVQTAPTGFICSIANASGVIGTSDVSNVRVSCSPQAYSLAGTITGLSASGLVLSDGTDVLNVASGAANFTLPNTIAFGSQYAVSISAQPVGLSCGITNGSGTMPATQVSNIVVSCGQKAAESVVYSFGAVTGDGAKPSGSLIQASDGNFYGMTSAGGAHATGAVIKLSTAGASPVESVLYSFGPQSSVDGAQPGHGSLIQASDGNLYGMTQFGGTLNQGAIVKVTLAGVESVLHSFGSTGDGASPFGSLIQASDGNLYGMTSGGGANETGAVIKIM